jgi:hypothetical protein
MLACTLVVWVLWNYVRRDLTFLPRISFGKALAAVILWGLLSFTVLTMISGARELMTPGAWKADGLTYKLASASYAQREDDGPSARRKHLEKLRAALTQFAALHQGRYPSSSELAEIPDELWLVPDGAGLRYQCIPGLMGSTAGELLVIEPEVEPDRRLVLSTDGEITQKTNAEIAARLQKRAKR